MDALLWIFYGYLINIFLYCTAFTFCAFLSVFYKMQGFCNYGWEFN